MTAPGYEADVALQPPVLLEGHRAGRGVAQIRQGVDGFGIRRVVLSNDIH